MANTYTPESTDPVIKLISRVRRHIPDREAPWFFTDAEIQDAIDEITEENGGTAPLGVAKLAAADLLESKATDEAFVQKVQKTLGEESDGAKTGDVVIKRAQKLRDQVKAAITAAALLPKPAAFDFSTAPNRD